MIFRKEEWRDIPGYEGLYQVSARGRVRSLDREVLVDDRPRRYYTRKLKGEVAKLSDRGNGYLSVSLAKNGERTTRNVHSLVLAAFRGKSNGLDGRHLDGNKANCRLWNLAYGTKVDNYNDRVLHGTCNTGERNQNASLTVEAVKAIRDSRLSVPELAEEYGVGKSCVRHVLKRRSWKDVS